MYSEEIPSFYIPVILSFTVSLQLPLDRRQFNEIILPAILSGASYGPPVITFRFLSKPLKTVILNPTKVFYITCKNSELQVFFWKPIPMLSSLSWFSSALVFLITLVLKVYTNMKPKVCFLLVSFEIIFCVEATNLGLPWVPSQVRVTAEAVVTAGNCASWFLVSGQSLDMLSLILWAFSLLFCRYPFALVVGMLINGMVLSLPPWGSFQDSQLVWPGVSFLSTNKIIFEFPLESTLKYLY